MIKLKIILKSKLFLIILIIIAILKISFIKSNNSIFNINDSNFVCTVLSNNKNKYLLDCGELLETYIDDENVKIGDILEIEGNLKEYSDNSNFNLFDYKTYQENRNIYYQLNIKKYNNIGISNNLIIIIKRFILDRISNLKSFNYLNAFILGNKDKVDTDSLKKLGIIHLFSISGMHISFFISFIDKFINKSKIKNIIIIIFLLFYYLLIKSVSLLRCILFFLIKKINIRYNLKFSKYKEIIVAISLILIIRPKAIYDLGFYYSVILSSGISLINYKIKIKNKILKKTIISIYIFLLSFPLNIYTSSEVNILSIIYNLIFIPFVSYLLFPLSLLTLLFPFLDNVLLFFINIFDFLINIFKNIDISFIFKKPSIILIILYYLLIISIIYNHKIIYLLLLLLFIHYNYNIIFNSKFIIFLDVGQGDSSLIHINNSNILIDTGGNINKNIVENITIPLLKSYGISKIDYLILTHGDYDHMGDSINLINNFNVSNVILNCGELDELETELINTLDKKEIQYYSCIKELNVDDNKLYFLQTKEYDNENDNSNVIYTEINEYKFMFMGDSGVEKEKDILEKYNISDVDVLKVGHHGSKTSSSEEFINEVNPKYSIISVGKNNRYGHPNKKVLKTLEHSKIYRTDQNGSVMIKIKNRNVFIMSMI